MVKPVGHSRETKLLALRLSTRTLRPMLRSMGSIQYSSYKFVHPEAKHPLKRNKPDQGPQNHLALIKTATTQSISFQFFSFFLQLIRL